jgi:hypothetical protein
MKLNLGCGFQKLQGFVNVDNEPLCKPDILHNLEMTPWPIADDQFDQVLASHVLEHLGQTTESYFRIIKELWRVCKDGAIIEVHVPHPRHDNFLHDPTHVRAITPIGLAMFDQLRNINDHKNGGAETKLGLMNGVDFELLDSGMDLCDPWKSAYERGELTREQVNFEVATKLNVCYQYQIILKVHKPLRGAQWLAELHRQG